ncbi:hypothetical protein A2U01_0105146, partial [Trifolium medium]|nr:hypothetical protein [Trifolium medium]
DTTREYSGSSHRAPHNNTVGLLTGHHRTTQWVLSKAPRNNTVDPLTGHHAITQWVLW